MKTNIMIITSAYLKNHLEKYVKKFNSSIEFSIGVYKNFSHISELYNENANKCDGFLVTGKIAKQAILQNKMNFVKPIESFELSLSDIYRTIIDLVLSNRDIDLKRVFFDFLIPISENISVEDFLKKGKYRRLSKKIDDDFEKFDLGHTILIEENLKREILHLWNLKTFDTVICQFSSIIPTLEEYGIPFIYPLPSEEHFIDTVDNLLYEIKLEKMKNNYPAIIRIDTKSFSENKKIENVIKKYLANLVVDFNYDNEKEFIDFIITSGNLAKITNNFKSSILSSVLKEETGLNIPIAYGIGRDFSNAVRNSEIAQKEVMHRNESFIVDCKNNLIGPLDSKYLIVVENDMDENVIRIAEESKLSTNTIQKLMALTESKNSRVVTSSLIASHFDTGSRNANRILQNLVQSGYATLTSEKSNNTKGRPIRIYEINF
ncbi:hypothetical protein [uncultured Peptoniphilus sp.]|uniref:hypothetical protein n=1 Tax=uncultured Peptoniphilus sp. TaxID=254354 RepID=UPI002805BBDC|nr:hypothetical protein [uncultured Peptoniphilus sp.]